MRGAVTARNDTCRRRRRRYQQRRGAAAPDTETSASIHYVLLAAPRTPPGVESFAATGRRVGRRPKSSRSPLERRSSQTGLRIASFAPRVPRSKRPCVVGMHPHGRARQGPRWLHVPVPEGGSDVDPRVDIASASRLRHAFRVGGAHRTRGSSLLARAAP